MKTPSPTHPATTAVGSALRSDDRANVSDWREQAEHAVRVGQTANEFLLSVHPANRPAAIKAFRKASSS
jgi:hypothetical protein